jgi:uncharacterized protein (TIGR02231 family)
MIALLVAVALVPSQVVKVVVYPDRAQVTRAETVACGTHKIVQFAAIPPSADRTSFRAHTDVGTLDGLRAESRPQTEAYSAEVQLLDDKLEQLAVEQRELDDARERQQQAARLAQDYAAVAHDLVGHEMTEPGPATKAWQAAFDRALEARLAAAAAVESNATHRRALERQREELEAKRARSSAASTRSTFLAEAIVSCPTGPGQQKTARVELSYVVGGASWSPAYAVRELGAGLQLVSYATVVQSTGEDWHAAELVLSTALPRDRATPPEIAPLKVWAESQRPPRKVIVGREEKHEHAEITSGETVMLDGRMRVAAQGLSVQLAVPERADVEGDGTPARLELGRSLLKAPVRLRSVPKLAPFVFRVAEATNAAPLPLLPGPVDVFRRGDFVARYQLERVAEGARFDLTFGLEEAVKVKRITVEELVREHGVLGPTRRRRFAYRFEVQNHLARAEEVEIAEPVPVSELGDVKVGIDASSTGGYALRAEDGIVTWRLKLAPGEKRTVELRYHIDVPASYDAGGS